MGCTHSQQKEKFPPISPDFDLRINVADGYSQRDTIQNARIYGEWCQTWLVINRKSRRVAIYRQGQEVEVLASP